MSTILCPYLLSSPASGRKLPWLYYFICHGSTNKPQNVSIKILCVSPGPTQHATQPNPTRSIIFQPNATQCNSTDMQLYSLVARGKTVLAEFTFATGNFPTITRVLLGKIPPEDGKMSYVYDQLSAYPHRCPPCSCVCVSMPTVELSRHVLLVVWLCLSLCYSGVCLFVPINVCPILAPFVSCGCELEVRRFGVSVFLILLRIPIFLCSGLRQLISWLTDWRKVLFLFLFFGNSLFIAL